MKSNSLFLHRGTGCLRSVIDKKPEHEDDDDTVDAVVETEVLSPTIDADVQVEGIKIFAETLLLLWVCFSWSFLGSPEAS